MMVVEKQLARGVAASIVSLGLVLGGCTARAPNIVVSEGGIKNIENTGSFQIFAERYKTLQLL